MSTTKMFIKYVSQNILGMLGISLYILADTFFISVAEGADGIAALNLVLPVYSVIYGVGSMLGVGAAIRFAILRAQKDGKADGYFGNAMAFAFILSLPFILIGVGFVEPFLQLLGADAAIVTVGTPYTKIFMLFAPCFMWNQICNAFVRNDGNPTLAMAATLGSSLFNIVMDYVLMFPLGMGMAGAALATSISPVLGMSVCCVHFFSKRNTIVLNVKKISMKYLWESCQLGVSAFVGEMSSGVITMVFNMLLLELAGNIGVAAYGIVANIALVATSVFNGTAQGAQPLFSEYYGKKDTASIYRVLKLGMVTAAILAGMIFGIIYIGAHPIAEIFNSEGNLQMVTLAETGLKIYFIGFLFAGLNIVGTGYLSAIEAVKWAFTASIMRGFVAIVICAIVLAKMFGITGVWMAFPVAEAITLIITIIAILNTKKME